MHVFEDRFPLAPTATFTPPHAPADAYREVQRALGLSRVVVVQPTGYAFDNHCTLEALAALGPEARAVVVVAPGTGEAELASLDATRCTRRPLHDAAGRRARLGRPRGDRAARSSRSGGTSTCSSTAATCRRGKRCCSGCRAGWRSTTSASSSARRAPRVQASPRSAGCSTAAAAGSSCRRRTRARRAVRPSTPTSRRSPAALAERYPERCLWASNWPHPNTTPALRAGAARMDRALHRLRREPAEDPGRQPRLALSLLKRPRLTARRRSSSAPGPAGAGRRRGTGARSATTSAHRRSRASPGRGNRPRRDRPARRAAAAP